VAIDACVLSVIRIGYNGVLGMVCVYVYSISGYLMLLMVFLFFGLACALFAGWPSWSFMVGVS
jgi:hypothetical protein